MILVSGIGCHLTHGALAPQELWQGFVSGQLPAVFATSSPPLEPAQQLVHVVRAALSDYGCIGAATACPVVLLGSGLLDIVESNLRQHHPIITIAPVATGVNGALKQAADILAACKGDLGVVVLLVANYAHHQDCAQLTGAVAFVLTPSALDLDRDDDQLDAVYAAVYPWCTGMDIFSVDLVTPTPSHIAQLLTSVTPKVVTGTAVDLFGFGGVLSQAVSLCKCVLAVLHATIPPQSSAASAWTFPLEVNATQWTLPLHTSAVIASLFALPCGALSGVCAQHFSNQRAVGTHTPPASVICLVSSAAVGAELALAARTPAHARTLQQSPVCGSRPGQAPLRAFVVVSPSNLPAPCLTTEAGSLCGVETAVYFVCGGLGTQWVGMGQPLWHLAAFRRSIALSQSVLPDGVGQSLEKLLTSNTSGLGVSLVETFVGIVALQIAVWDTLGVCGLGALPRPCFVGHSVGEITCACLTGALTRAQALAVAATIARVATEISSPPTALPVVMLAVALSATAAQDLCIAAVGTAQNVWVACDNGPASATLAGNAEELARLANVLKADGVAACSVWSGGVPFHCPGLSAAGPALRAALTQVLAALSVTRSPAWLSTAVVDSAASFDAEYLVRNFTGPVQFQSAVRQIPPGCTVIDLSAHPLLANLVSLTRPVDLPAPLAILSREMRLSEAALPVLLGRCHTRNLLPLDAVPAAIVCGNRLWRMTPAELLWPVHAGLTLGPSAVIADVSCVTKVTVGSTAGDRWGNYDDIHLTQSELTMLTTLGPHSILSPGILVEKLVACVVDFTGVAGAAIELSNVDFSLANNFVAALAVTLGVQLVSEVANHGIAFSLGIAGANAPLLTGNAHWMSATVTQAVDALMVPGTLESQSQLYSRLATRGLAVPLRAQKLGAMHASVDGGHCACVSNSDTIGQRLDAFFHAAVLCFHPGVATQSSMSQTLRHVDRLNVSICAFACVPTETTPTAAFAVARVVSNRSNSSMSVQSSAVDMDGLFFQRLVVLPALTPYFARGWLTRLFSAK